MINYLSYLVTIVTVNNICLNFTFPIVLYCGGSQTHSNDLDCDKWIAHTQDASFVLCHEFYFQLWATRGCISQYNPLHPQIHSIYYNYNTHYLTISTISALNLHFSNFLNFLCNNYPFYREHCLSSPYTQLAPDWRYTDRP